MEYSSIVNKIRTMGKKGRGLLTYFSSGLDWKPKVAILVYHRVLPVVKFNPLKNIIAQDIFVRQIERITKWYSVVALTDITAQCRTGLIKNKVQIVLTFDDGYRDSYEIVFPILREKGLPATFFLTTDYVNGNAQFLDDRLKNSKTGDLYDCVKDEFITWENVKTMAKVPGIEIGSHGLSHRSLMQMPLEEAEEEIRKSKGCIERNINKPCRHFALPFGSRRDFNKNIINLVKEAGYESCLLNVHGYNHLEKDSFCFRRIIMEETTDITCILG